jgi:glycosyltransferase involved in cell wall biosynthesis
MDSRKQRALIIIPAYNEENTIARVILGLRHHVPTYDRIVVNDGSQDSTTNILTDMGEKQIILPFNIGYGLALQTGLKYALLEKYQVIICMDADGQHRPEDVPLLVNALYENNADVVIGSRFSHQRPYKMPLDRRIGQIIFSRLTRLLIGRRIYDTTSGFKVFRADACKAIIDGTFMDFHIESIVRLSLFGFKIVEHPAFIEERAYGSSMHSYLSIIQYPLKTLLLTIVATADAILARREK